MIRRSWLSPGRNEPNCAWGRGNGRISGGVGGGGQGSSVWDSAI